MLAVYRGDELREINRKKVKALEEIKRLSPLALELVKKMVSKVAIEEAENQAKIDTVQIVHCLYATTLNADRGFGKKRINSTIDGVNGQFAGLRSGAIEPKNDIIRWCIDKGIDFTAGVQNDG